MESSWDTIETLFSGVSAFGKPSRARAGQNGKSCERTSRKARSEYEGHF